MVDNVQNIKADKWYDSPELVGGLLLFLNPIGLYGLLKSKKLVSQPVKIIVSISMLTAISILLYFIVVYV